ncbi:DUF481 domain-containing protein [Oxalicibacterium faecigallinarum]|uniref:DUF481 domain-containing protein n=1 Tax=Oxalicibacterium faecigallinarum TaxID=573741 RepID=A0A8J3ARF8_9BURK|nr:DUF481 domain-containing protein [Oxalicibacterium faecigallinarum]GGI20726.1 hypothetical protein GCM10008066_25470 [Oxalicibacterium faecigallinarum]
MFYPTPSSLRDMVIDRSKGVSNMNSSTSARLKRRTSALCLLATTTLAALSTHAATVTLNNGDQISGTLKQLTGDTVIFESAVFGEIKIPFKEVSKLTTDEDVRVQLSDGTALKGKVAMQDDGAVQIAEQPTEAPLTVPRQQVAAFNPPIIDESMKYTGRLDLGGAMNRGNSTDEKLNINGEFVARDIKNRYTLGWEFNEASSAQVTTTSNRRLLGKYDRFLNEKDYIFFSVKGETDKMAALDLRSSVGTGYGRQFIETPETKFSGEVGVNYIKERYATAPDESFPTLSLGMKYDRKFWEDKLVFFEYLSIDASLEDASDTLLRNRIGFRVPIAKGLNLSTQFNLDYDNQPVPGKKKSDRAFIVSIGYGF